MIILNPRDRRRGVIFAAWLVAFAAIVLLLAPLDGLADNDEAVSRHIAAAEDALSINDYWTASSEYRQAAALSDDSKIAKQATRFAYTYGFNENARDSAQRWVAIDQSSDEALLYLALLELRSGDIKQSRNSFRKVLQRGDIPADERLVNLVPFLSEEDPANADKLMRQLSKPYKKSPYAHYAAAVLALYAGDSDEALKRSKTALQLKPEWLKPHLLYARALLLAGDAEGAIDYTARLVGDNPDPDPEARLELAIMYLSAGRDDDALSQVNQVLLEQPSRTDALRLLAIINFRLENLDAAAQDFRDLLASGQYTMDAFYYLARIADYRGEQERAISLYSKVTQGDNAVFSQRRAGGILAQQRKYDQAQKHLEDFGRRHPNYAVDMIQAQAQLLASQERYDEAIDYFDRVITYRPDSESALLGKAELLLRMDRLEDAIEHYRRATRQWPESAIVLNALGYTLADRTQDYKEAMKLIKKALKLDPESAAIIDSYGWVLYRQGDYEDALRELERAYGKLEDPEVAAHIIEVLWTMGRTDEALERLVEAEERWPESTLLKTVRNLVAPDD
jgi:tetratricopeptide (TPR) repeat protein